MADPAALVFVLFGIPMAIWPYGMAKFEEQLDAIGSKRRSSEVEPADWKVALTRIVGIGMAVVGGFMVFSG